MPTPRLVNSYSGIGVLVVKMNLPITQRTLQLFQQYRGINSGLDSVAPEVFYQVMICLQPKDIAVCMCVSKTWKLLLSTSYFWRKYLNSCFSFDDDDDDARLTGILHELGSAWFYGWGSGTVPPNPGGELFEELPKRWKSGIVHPVGADVRSKIDDHRTMYEALYQIQKLQDEVNDREIVYIGGTQNSGECPVDMILFHWDFERLPSQEEIIEIFHFNINLHLVISYQRSENKFSDENKLENIFRCRRHLPRISMFYKELGKLLNGFIIVNVDYQGRSQTFRPSPVIILTRLPGGWCGGVLTGVW